MTLWKDTESILCGSDENWPNLFSTLQCRMKCRNSRRRRAGKLALFYVYQKIRTMKIERKLFSSNASADRYVEEQAARGRKLISYSLRKGGLFDLSVGFKYNIEATIVWDE